MDSRGVRFIVRDKEENRVSEIEPYGAEKRGLYKQSAYRCFGCWRNENGQNHLRDGYGLIAHDNVSPSGNGNIDRDIFEISEFPLDRTRTADPESNGKS